MDTLRTPAALASLIAANLVPLAGIVFLGWSPASLLVLYFVDTFLSLGAVVLLVAAHVTGDEGGKPIRGWRNWAKAACGLVFLGAIMALPLGLPLFFLFGDDFPMLLEKDRGLPYAILWQAVMSCVAVVRQHRELKQRHDDDRVLAGRMFYLVARWMTVFFATMTLAIPLLGPVIGGFVMVAIYCGASVYFELNPERAQRFIRGKDAKPIKWEGDLDGKAAEPAGSSGDKVKP
jgi:hypothetical protein